MTKPVSCAPTVADAKLALKRHIRRYDPCQRETQTSYLYTLLAFLESLQRDHPHPPGMIVVSESRLMDWMTDVSAACGFASAVQKIQLVRHFMRHLQDAGVVRSDPMASIRLRYGQQGWAGIVRAA